MKVTHAITAAIAKAEAEGRVSDSKSDFRPKQRLDTIRSRRDNETPSLVGWPWSIRLIVPAKVVSEMNRRGHWTERHNRFKVQAAAVDLAWLTANLKRNWLIVGRFTVTLTRIGRGQMLDDDNLQSAFKGVRDRIAEHIGLDDADPRIQWKYGQRAGKPCVEVLIEKV